jgi:Uma2 family endonuclease
MELDWVVSEDTVARTDLLVVCGEVPERHLESLPSLILEVLSPTTKANDWGYKRDFTSVGELSTT